MKKARICLIKNAFHAAGPEYAADELLKFSHACLHQINVLFKENIQYLKATAIFSALHANAQRSDELRQPIAKIQQHDQLMNALLEMKGKYGAGYIQAGYSSAQQAWKMKQEQHSPRDATCWNELLQVN